MLHCFEFEAFGSYSETFGWDTGLTPRLSKESIKYSAARWECQLALEQGYPVMCELPKEPQVGVYTAYYECYGGNRNMSGYVVARSKAEAVALLEQMAEAYPVKEYIEPAEQAWLDLCEREAAA